MIRMEHEPRTSLKPLSQFQAALTFQEPPTLPPQKQFLNHNGCEADHKKSKNNSNQFLKYHIIPLTS